MKPLHIAIDGPAGAGKSTIAYMLAEKIKVDYLDTGAMYRALTFHVLESNIKVDKEDQIIVEAEKLNIDFMNNSIYIDQKNIDKEIRSAKVSSNVSLVSKIPRVREIMVEKQRQIARGKSVIMDGRDIGTVVLPNADIKFYLDASIEIRAKRRYDQLEIKESIDFESLKNDIMTRDMLDINREIAPLKKAKDAVIIDTSKMSIEQVLEEMVNTINRERGGI